MADSGCGCFSIGPVESRLPGQRISIFHSQSLLAQFKEQNLPSSGLVGGLVQLALKIHKYPLHSHLSSGQVNARNKSKDNTYTEKNLKAWVSLLPVFLRIS